LKFNNKFIDPERKVVINQIWNFFKVKRSNEKVKIPRTHEELPGQYDIDKKVVQPEKRMYPGQDREEISYYSDLKAQLCVLMKSFKSKSKIKGAKKQNKKNMQALQAEMSEIKEKIKLVDDMVLLAKRLEEMPVSWGNLIVSWDRIEIESEDPCQLIFCCNKQKIGEKKMGKWNVPLKK
jgi:hypothetical protein